MDPRTVPPVSNLPLFSGAISTMTHVKYPGEEWRERDDLGDRLTPLSHGRAATQKGMDGASDAARGLPEATRAEVRRVILAERFDFTTDLLRARFSQATNDVLNHPHHRTALAGMVTTLAKAGLIRATGSYVRSVRKAARGRTVKVWRCVPLPESTTNG